MFEKEMNYQKHATCILNLITVGKTHDLSVFKTKREQSSKENCVIEQKNTNSVLNKKNKIVMQTIKQHYRIAILFQTSLKARSRKT